MKPGGRGGGRGICFFFLSAFIFFRINGHANLFISLDVTNTIFNILKTLHRVTDSGVTVFIIENFLHGIKEQYLQVQMKAATQGWAPLSDSQTHWLFPVQWD